MDSKVFIRNMELLRMGKGEGMTQDQISVDIGLRNAKRWATIVRTGNCSLQEIAKICAYFKVNIDDMLTKKALCLIKFE
jgi:hypothetical protein